MIKQEHSDLNNTLFQELFSLTPKKPRSQNSQTKEENIFNTKIEELSFEFPEINRDNQNLSTSYNQDIQDLSRSFNGSNKDLKDIIDFDGNPEDDPIFKFPETETKEKNFLDSIQRPLQKNQAEIGNDYETEEEDILFSIEK